MIMSLPGALLESESERIEALLFSIVLFCFIFLLFFAFT